MKGAHHSVSWQFLVRVGPRDFAAVSFARKFLGAKYTAASIEPIWAAQRNARHATPDNYQTD